LQFMQLKIAKQTEFEVQNFILESSFFLFLHKV
jgi:hypothetical protein